MNLFGNTHARYEALVTEFIDGVIDEAGEAKLNEHMATCAECAAEVRDQQAMLGVLRAQPMAKVPRSFALPYAPPVVAPVENRVSKWLRSMQVATAAAAFVLIALVGINVAQGPSTADALTGASAEEFRMTGLEDPSRQSEFTFDAEGAPSSDGAPPVTSLVPPDEQSNDGAAADDAAATPAEPQSGGRNAIEWALIVMSGFTGVMALAVVGATWLPRRTF